MEKNNTIEYDKIHEMFELKNQRNFEFYLENIFTDFCTMEGNKNLGISKIRFIDFLKLPILICEKLFLAMDKNKDNYLSLDEICDNLSLLYFGSFEETANMIFQIYDFDRDGIIAIGDVKIVLSYLPLKSDKTKIEYKYQLDSLTELDEIIKSTFNGHSSLNFASFVVAIKQKSDIYLQLLCYLYQRCPFQEKNVKIVSKSSSRNVKMVSKSSNNSLKANNVLSPTSSPIREKVVLISPSCKTRFSPAGDFLNKNDDSDDDKIKPKRYDSFTDARNSIEVSGIKGMVRLPNKTGVVGIKGKDGIRPKQRSSFNNYNTRVVEESKTKEKEMEELNLGNDNGNTIEEEHEIIDFPAEDGDLITSVLIEGMIYEVSKDKNSIKPIWLVLIGRDIFYYKSEVKDEMKSVHNVSGCFIKENGEEMYNGTKYYSFSIIFSNNTRTYYCKERSVAKDWTSKLRSSIGYKNFFDFYEMLDDLGEGQFGLVKLGVHTKTQEKVAIKIIKKAKMKPNEIELVKSEIDIMKVCRHPSIVRFLDHFENSEYIFIVMEYINSGHLRNYLTKKKFLISEKKASKIIFQISNGLKYLHHYGIIHRDLKPDNIMVADPGVDFQIKIMDFGLSKILGPRERTAEGYGTLCFVAPEIIMREPYNNSIDIWSLGIMLYYIISGDLPFDDENNDEKTIAKKIVYEPVQFPDKKWKNKSKEIKHFIEQCLIKDLKKRILIDKILTHDWIKMMDKSEEK